MKKSNSLVYKVMKKTSYNDHGYTRIYVEISLSDEIKQGCQKFSITADCYNRKGFVMGWQMS